MTSRAALSPAWLGLFAALSFGGLVVASFASGYHLVMKSAARSAPAAAAGDPSGAAAESAGDTSGAAASAGDAPSALGGAAGAAARGPASSGLASSDPPEAIVRPNLRPDRALVRRQPESGAVVARLPSNQRVALRGRSGDWLHIEFDRKGKHVDGWTQESNLQLR
jgi:hypothetical protein